MRNETPLATLIKLAQDKIDDATRRLGQLQNVHTSAAEKHKMLLQYRQEYLDQLQTLMHHGVASSHLRNFQQFISTLDAVIEQQHALTVQADTQLRHGRRDWQQCKHRLTSFDTLVDRISQQQILISNKREQRDSDEHTARQFYQPSNVFSE